VIEIKKTTLLFVLSLCFIMAIVPCVNVKAAVPAPAQDHPFVVGQGGLPWDLDPHKAWDSASIDLCYQVFETLFDYNFTNVEGPFVAKLGTAYRWIDSMNLEVELREGVKFHDDTDFNAAAVKWNFDRMTNVSLSGETWLTDGIYMIIPDSFRTMEGVDLSWLPAGEAAMIWNRTEVIDDYKVQFVLNFPFVPFMDALTFMGFGMISPTTHEDDFEHIWDTTRTELVGTGPFKFISHSETDRETILEAYPEYWRGPPYITNLTLSYIDDSDTRNDAIFTDDLQYLIPDPLRWDEMNDDVDVTASKGPKSMSAAYLGLSCINLELEQRRAIAAAFNTTYVIEEIMGGYAYNLDGPLPEGIKYYKEDLDAPQFDIPAARDILIDAEYITAAEVTGWTDADWIAKATGADPVFSVNYTYNSGNAVRERIGALLYNSMQYIGVNVTIYPMEWAQFGHKLHEAHEELEVFYVGWIADYLHPSNFLIPLFSKDSASNSPHLQDDTTEQWIWEAIGETDEATARGIYEDLQQRLVDLQPRAYVYQGMNLNAWRAEWTGFIPNSLGKMWLFEMHEVGSGWSPDNPAEPSKIIEPVTIPGFPVEVVGLLSVIGLAGVIVLIRRKLRY
jgi:ABC-type transport system substrate-binding protein